MFYASNPVLAAYWANWDYCTILYYRLTDENYYYYYGGYKIYSDIRRALGNYQINLVLLIQWENCIPFPYWINYNQQITFQLALASDGQNSYAIINYPYDKSNINEYSFFPTQIGYFDGTERRVYVSKNWQGANYGIQEQLYNLDKSPGNECTLRSNGCLL